MTHNEIIALAKALYAARVERGLTPEQPASWQVNELHGGFEPYLQVVPVFEDGTTGDQLVYSLRTGELIQEGAETF